MYSREDRIKAVELYIKYGRRPKAVMRELGYPSSKGSLRVWYADYLEEQRSGHICLRQTEKSKYSPEQKQAAVDFYLDHTRSVSATIHALGYPGRDAFLKWLDELAPGQRVRCISTGSVRNYTPSQKAEVVTAFCNRDRPAAEVASASGVSRYTLYRWQNKILGSKGGTVAMKKDPPGKDDRDALISEVAALQAEVQHLKLERDILEGTVELIKKDPGATVGALTNKEKTQLILSLNSTWPIKLLLAALKLPKSSYYYQRSAIVAPKKYDYLRRRIRELFNQARKCYGYRRIHALLLREEIRVSEKVIIRIVLR